MKTKEIGGSDAAIDQTYNYADSAEQFRENYRLVFSAAVVATFFVIPSNEGVLWLVLKWCIGIVSALAATYLIMTASAVQYKKPYTMYSGIIRISEKVRQVIYDLSITLFGIFFLTALGLLSISAVSEDFKNWTGTLSFGWALTIWLVAGLIAFGTTKLIARVIGKIVGRVKNKK